MDLRQLRYFVKVADCGSFTTAARLIPIAQSALSRHVRDLEKELRHSLFYRNGRGVQLTVQGEQFLHHARAILDRVQQAKNELAASNGELVGKVRIGLPPSISRTVSAPLIVHCKNLLPDVELSLVEGHSANIIEWELSSQIDIGIVYDPPSSSTYRTIPVLETPLYFIAAPRRLPAGLRQTGVIPLLRASTLPLILPCHPHSIRGLVERSFKKAGLRLLLAREVEGLSGMAAILDLIEAGEGYGILPLHSSRTDTDRLRSGLEYYRIADPEITLTLQMMVPYHVPSAPIVDRVAGLLRTFLPSRLNKVSAKHYTAEAHVAPREGPKRRPRRNHLQRKR